MTRKQEWKGAETALYPLVMLLLTEGRITGKFDLPLQDLVKFKELEERFKRLEERVDNLDFSSPNPTHGRESQPDGE